MGLFTLIFSVNFPFVNSHFVNSCVSQFPILYWQCTETIEQIVIITSNNLNQICKVLMTKCLLLVDSTPWKAIIGMALWAIKMGN